MSCFVIFVSCDSTIFLLSNLELMIDITLITRSYENIIYSNTRTRIYMGQWPV